MKAELTAENRPACTHLGSATSTESGNDSTDKDEGGVQVLVILFRVITVKLFGFSTVYGKEVGSGIIGPQWFSELSEGGMEAVFGCRRSFGCRGNRTDWTHHFGSIWTTGGSRG